MAVDTAPEGRGARRNHFSPDGGGKGCIIPARRFEVGAAVLLLLLCLHARPAAADAMAADPALAAWTAASAPPLLLPSLDGPPRGLADARGKVVLVHFFATWCEPCRDELESLSRLAASRPDVAILAVDVGEVPVRVRRFLAERPVAFPVLLDIDRKASAAWGARGLPTSFVLDGRLAPRLAVVGDLDWSAPGIVEALDAVAAEEARGIAAVGGARAPVVAAEERAGFFAADAATTINGSDTESASITKGEEGR